MTLNELKIGATAKIVRLNGEGSVKRRMMDIGDPIELTVRGYELSIRKDEAAAIEVS